MSKRSQVGAAKNAKRKAKLKKRRRRQASLLKKKPNGRLA